MKINALTIVALVLFPLLCGAQTNEVDPKGQLHFNIGPEYRITPIYDTTIWYRSEYSTFTNIDTQNSGPGLHLVLEYFITKNLSFSFSNTLRYDMVIAQKPQGSYQINVGKIDYKLLYDYHFYLAYYVRMSDKTDIFIDAGFSFLNRNTDFSVKEIFPDGEGFGIADFSFLANRISIGYKKGRSKISMGMYITQSTEYLDVTTSFIVPHIGFNYNIAKL